MWGSCKNPLRPWGKRWDSSNPKKSPTRRVGARIGSIWFLLRYSMDIVRQQKWVMWTESTEIMTQGDSHPRSWSSSSSTDSSTYTETIVRIPPPCQNNPLILLQSSCIWFYNSCLHYLTQINFYVLSLKGLSLLKTKESCKINPFAVLPHILTSISVPATHQQAASRWITSQRFCFPSNFSSI